MAGPDLSQYSTEDLVAAYEAQKATDLSRYSTEELMAAYGAQQPATRLEGILGDIGTGAKHVASGAVEGMAGLGGLVLDFGRAAIMGPKMDQDPLQYTKELTGGAEQMLPESDPDYRYARTVGQFVGPGGLISGIGRKGLGAAARMVATDTAAGLGAQSAEDATGNKTIAPLAGALLGAGLPRLAIGKPAGGIAKAARAEADALELRAFGVNKADVNRVNKNNFYDLVDATGEIKNPLNTAIASFRTAAGKKISEHDPQSLITEIQRQEEGLAQELGKLLGTAAKQQKTTVTPSFKRTIDYVDSLSGLSDKRGAEIAKEAMSDVLRKIDRNDITSIHRAKIAVGKEINSAAWGADRTALQSNIYKRIYGDLRETVEQGYEQITKSPGTEIKALNNEIGMRMGLHKSFTDMLNQTQSQDVVNRLMQLWRSSGGWGIPAAGAAYGTGLGIPAAVGTLIAGKYLQSPKGKLQLADALRSRAVQGGLAGASTIGGRPGALMSRSGALAVARPIDSDLAPSRSSSTEAQEATAPQARLSTRTGLMPKSILGQSGSQQGSGSTSLSSDSSYSDYAIKPKFDAPKAEKTPISLKSQGDSDMKMTSENAGAVLDAVRQVESGGGKYLKSPAGALGPYQFMPATAKELGVNPRDKDESDDRAGAQKMITRLQKKFGSLELALAAYNWGEGNIAKAIAKAGSEDWEKVKKHVPTETAKYVPKVLGLLA